MKLLYNVGIQFYYLAIFMASLFNVKAKQWIAGRKNIFLHLEKVLDGAKNVVWFHVSSLGEFEQGRPVIEALRNQYPQYKILLTFFSPSGYEIRKNTPLADFVFYLPLDTPKNAKRFIEIVNPQKVFFVKYEFWYHYLNLCHTLEIPTFLFSAIFRKDQVFFKSTGKWYRKMLKCFNHLFVQNIESQELLSGINITNVSVAGDTRFDRVYDIVQETKDIPLAVTFKQNKTIVIAGSSWKEDEEKLISYINESKKDCKYIIAPHEIHLENIKRIQKSLKVKCVLFSEANKQNVVDSRVLVIDNIGMLSSLYAYADIALIGGGFGKGIHNTLEAATFGMPIFFGPNYHKFSEAVQLIEEGAAFSFSSTDELRNLLDRFLNSGDDLKKSAKISSDFVKRNCGATKMILTKSIGS